MGCEVPCRGSPYAPQMTPLALVDFPDIFLYTVQISFARLYTAEVEIVSLSRSVLCVGMVVVHQVNTIRAQQSSIRKLNWWEPCVECHKCAQQNCLCFLVWRRGEAYLLTSSFPSCLFLWQPLKRPGDTEFPWAPKLKCSAGLWVDGERPRTTHNWAN